jgi:hypothetical protein
VTVFCVRGKRAELREIKAVRARVVVCVAESARCLLISACRCQDLLVGNKRRSARSGTCGCNSEIVGDDVVRHMATTDNNPLFGWYCTRDCGSV